MKIFAIIQCRLNSTRLPGKAALDLHGKPLLARVIDRCRLARRLNGIVVATSDQLQDDIVGEIAAREGVEVFRGALDDVRGRYLNCAHHLGLSAFVRVTADNPYVEPALIDDLIDQKTANPSCPYLVHDLDRVVYGTASELVDLKAFGQTGPEFAERAREHVTTGMRDLTGALVLAPRSDLADPTLSLTIDTIEDFVGVWRLSRRYGFGAGSLERLVADYRRQETPVQHFPTRG